VSATSNRRRRPVCCVGPGLFSTACGAKSTPSTSYPNRGEQDRVFAGATTDVEHLAVNPAGLLQLGDRRLRFADHHGAERDR